MNNAFWSSMKVVLKVFSPLVKVLRLAHGERIHSLGFIYGEILSAKESIKEATEHAERSYEPILKIVEEKMKSRLDTPLHITAYFLNPFYFYKDPDLYNNEVMQTFIACVETFYHRDFEKQNLVVNREVNLYKSKSGSFGCTLARKGCEKKDENFDPGNWWATYGCEMPHLRRLATRILALTSSSSVEDWLLDRNEEVDEDVPLVPTSQAPQARVLYDDDFESDEEEGGGMEFQSDYYPEDPVFRDLPFA
ncbi:unnamed protein product [Microthlaspi erraticum]|uniref:HAT C-terminal dimerisation domain-containing protein n=1 Tax=Microthlaspi erraticum TaxID=1685480 RepID=A0A6D2IAF8_9BRAS|nr:unnamed protein product [Microthlaspi erraticum]